MSSFEKWWDATVLEIRKGAEEAATGKRLSRVTMPLSDKERRRGQRVPSWDCVRGRDILHSLSYWRRVRNTCGHAAIQYIAHCRVAFA